MSKPLSDRLIEVQTVLGQVQEALGRNPGKLPTDLEVTFRHLADFRNDVRHWLDILTARESALLFLDGLEFRVDGNDAVEFGGATVHFRIARLLGIQAYIAANWAFADRILAFIGKVLCTEDKGFDRVRPTQLMSHFIGKDAKRSAAAPFFYSTRHAFGWSIGISYALRNQFVHAAGSRNGIEFFEGPTSTSHFKIALDAWNGVQEQARIEGVSDNQHRNGTLWHCARSN